MDLRSAVLRLAQEHPELRRDIVPVLRRTALGAPSELHVYDFDGTLFRTPVPPPHWPKPHRQRWWAHPHTMDEPCVPKNPGSDWWISAAIADAKHSTTDSNVLAILCTARDKNTEAKRRVPALLSQQGLRFSQVILSPRTETTEAWKAGVVKVLLKKHLSIQVVHVWEDNHDNLRAIGQMVTGLGLKFVAHPVKASHHDVECDAEQIRL